MNSGFVVLVVVLWNIDLHGLADDPPLRLPCPTRPTSAGRMLDHGATTQPTVAVLRVATVSCIESLVATKSRL